jgi:serine/threonine protein kinase
MCTAVGSPLYMAPEVFRQRYDNKCDLWSLGIIIFLNFSGECPFDLLEGDGLPQLQSKIENLEIVWNYFWDEET